MLTSAVDRAPESQLMRCGRLKSNSIPPEVQGLGNDKKRSKMKEPRAPQAFDVQFALMHNLH